MDQPIARIALLASLLIAAPVSPAAGAASGFTLVNNSGGALSGLAVRRVGDQAWKPLQATAAPGAAARVDFSDPDCAFDLRASVAGAGQLQWSGVNLCDVKRVTLNRDRSGRLWVDYD